MYTSGGDKRWSGALAALGLFALLAIGASAEETIVKVHFQQLGVNECSYGPAFWCQNITNAAGCKAFNHCLQTAWKVQTYPEDNDDVCTICKNMVKEARDALTSNATLDELKQVFYGSCQLLPLKVVKKECEKLADDFIPELVDTLASEMDPNAVCTVSGLCNNQHIDMLLNYKEKVDEQHACEKCSIAMTKAESLIESLSKNEVLNKVLLLCGELSSYSDACSSVVFRYNNEIYDSIKSGFTKRNVCILSGMCSEAFHPHADGYDKAKNALMGVEISNAGERGRVQVQQDSKKISDDLTCEFCESMVHHLRDILIANTTEEQFEDVLKGLCKQTKSFSSECLSVVSENYARIYQFLVGELNGKVPCIIVGLCPKSLNSRYDLNSYIPMFPLLPIELLPTQENLKTENKDLSDAVTQQSKHNPTLVVVDEQPPKMQDIKPVKKSPVIDLFYNGMHLVVNDVDMPTDKTVCFLCQSILNYVQQAVTDPKSEEEIRSALEKSCTVVPSSFESQCKQFVDQYGDAFISLVAQEVDPSIICPELKLCPDVDLVLTPSKEDGSSSACPMCVLLMSTLESEITNKDNEEEIKKKLQNLCTKLPSKWKKECTEFVAGKLESILDMFVAQVKPEEICMLLDVCKPKSYSSAQDNIDSNVIATTGQVTVVFPGFSVGELLSNNYKMLEEPKVPTPFCLVCTVVMKYINNEVKDKSNQAEIQSVLDSICRILPNVEENKCQDFVDSYSIEIMKAIQIGTSPTVACMAMMVCVDLEDDIHPIKSLEEVDTSDECAACEAFTTVFGYRIYDRNVFIEEIDLTELCFETATKYENQTNELINLIQKTCKLKARGADVNWVFKDIMKKMSHCPRPCVPKSSDTEDDFSDTDDSSDIDTEESSGDIVVEFHPKCTICKDVIKDIKKKIEASPAEEDIKDRLESLCDPLPNKTACVKFVDKYAKKVIDTLIDDVQEETICEEIGYC